MIEADIRIWVLTGDKQETAIEIGRSCKLIQPDMEELILTSKTGAEFEAKLLEQIKKRKVDLSKNYADLTEAYIQSGDCVSKRLCIIIDGPTLTFAFSE